MQIYDWTKMNLLPMDGLAVWLQYEQGVSQHGLMKDYSGNGRDVTQGTNPPVLTLDTPQGQPGWLFNGSCNPLRSAAAAIDIKHLFVIPSAADATFSATRGLVTGLAATDLVISQSIGTNLTGIASDAASLSNMAKGSGSLPAPVAGKAGVVQLAYNSGLTLDGLTVGAQRNVASTTWNGYVYEIVAYNKVLNDMELIRYYEYVAMRHHIWQEVA